MDHSEADNHAITSTTTPSGSQTHLTPSIQVDTSSSSSTTKTTSQRKRLQQKALVILEDYFQQVNQNPDYLERNALLKKIKAVPGCSHYDLTRLTSWFGSRRKRLRMKEQGDSTSPMKDNIDTPFDQGFPSLTPAAIQHLTVLASNQLHPSPELLKTWTTLLASSGAVEQDVINWIHHRNQEQSSQNTSTPSDTTSTTTALTPEPSAPNWPIWPISQSQTQSTSAPTSPAVAHPSDEHHDARATPSELLSPTSPTPISNNELNNYIIHGVRDALASPQSMSGMSTAAAPKTAAEFETLFSPFEQQISLLLHTLESA